MQRLEFADQLARTSEIQVRLDAVLVGERAKLFEPHDLRLSELLVGELVECRAAPQPEAIAE